MSPEGAVEGIISWVETQLLSGVMSHRQAEEILPGYDFGCLLIVDPEAQIGELRPANRFGPC